MKISGLFHRSVRHALLLPVILSGLQALAQQSAGCVLQPKEFQEKYRNAPGIVVDVRTPEECAEGIIEGAVQIDFRASDARERLKQLDRAKPVYLYCAAGGRSYQAARFLREQGYVQLCELEGGMGAWRDAGMPVVLPGSGGKR
ncbi:MAG: rhodanese-like domain-containing protein [Flavobacteriales bacterium]|nr:rhodanese-like domain-containing protein [Flavobacteriales bacterium]